MPGCKVYRCAYDTGNSEAGPNFSRIFETRVKVGLKFFQKDPTKNIKVVKFTLCNEG